MTAKIDRRLQFRHMSHVEILQSPLIWAKRTVFSDYQYEAGEAVPVGQIHPSRLVNWFRAGIVGVPLGWKPSSQEDSASSECSAEPDTVTDTNPAHAPESGVDAGPSDGDDEDNKADSDSDAGRPVRAKARGRKVSKAKEGE